MSTAAPTKAKANKSKPLKICLPRFFPGKSAKKKLAVVIKCIFFFLPSFVCLFYSEREGAGFLRSSYIGANNPSLYPVFSTKLE